MDGRRNFSPDPDADSRWYPEDRGYDDRGYDDRRDDRGGDDHGRGERGARGRNESERGYGDDRGYTPTRYADEREPDDGGYRVADPRSAGHGYGADGLSYGDSPSGQFSASSAFGAGAGRGPQRAGDSGEFSGEYTGRSRRSEAIDRTALQRPAPGGSGAAGSYPTSGFPASAPATGGFPASGPATGGFPASGPVTGGAPAGGLPTSGAPTSGVPTSGVPTSGPATGGFSSGGLATGAPIPGLTTSGSPIQGLPTVTPSGPVSGGPAGMGAAPGTSAFAAPTALTAAVPPPQQPRMQFGVGEDPGGAVYRSKRPGLAIALGLLTALFEVPVLRLFFEAMTAKDIPASGTLAGMFMIPALPMFALGLYGLIGGAAAASPGIRPWLRTPLAYLPIALLLFMAAGLAA
ncbi:hypothetical protein [Dactylosporangium matsuzakiense]|uniref:Uncharacterized protein n=1 Tax=Dactylosporangium matsuzakiense TaxID=53360 RepID=A0A9W6KH88_9ACTN|nr:hypothetical protein [Dactylosporangium matsuzakiense]UWZ46346.1 hypothetical protein Dmats_07920 [Dactylosporangium matsuzakiense]GLL02056.1 hypothetical protein GCM10017581_037980 [Dactylosporangium matsuzakiense]